MQCAELMEGLAGLAHSHTQQQGQRQAGGPSSSSSGGGGAWDGALVVLGGDMNWIHKEEPDTPPGWWVCVCACVCVRLQSLADAPIALRKALSCWVAARGRVS